MRKWYVNGRRVGRNTDLAGLLDLLEDVWFAFAAFRYRRVAQAQYEVGRLYHYVPLLDAVKKQDAIIALENIEQMFRWPFKPKEVLIYFYTVKHLRRLRRS